VIRIFYTVNLYEDVEKDKDVKGRALVLHEFLKGYAVTSINTNFQLLTKEQIEKLDKGEANLQSSSKETE
jgi:hypothetical protein